MDPLQRLHTLDNLATLLRTPPPGVPRTLRDGRLQVGSCATTAELQSTPATKPPANLFVTASVHAAFTSTCHSPFVSMWTGAYLVSNWMC